MRGLVAQHGQSERLLSVRSGVRIPPGPLLLRVEYLKFWHRFLAIFDTYSRLQKASMHGC